MLFTAYKPSSPTNKKNDFRPVTSQRFRRWSVISVG